MRSSFTMVIDKVTSSSLLFTIGLWAFLLLPMPPVYGQQKEFKKADSLRSAKDFKAYAKALKVVYKEASYQQNDPLLFQTHLRLLEYYTQLQTNKDSLVKYYPLAMKDARDRQDPYYIANYQFIWANGLVLIGNYTEALAIFQSLEQEVNQANYDFLPPFS